MRQTVLAMSILSFAAFSTPAFAQKRKPPLSPPPVYAIASFDKGGIVQVRYNIYRTVAEERERVIEVDGKKRTEKQIVHVPVVATMVFRRALKDILIYKASGEKVDAKDVKEELAKPKVVLYSEKGKKVDPLYLKIIKPETLIVVKKKVKRATPERKPRKLDP